MCQLQFTIRIVEQQQSGILPQKCLRRGLVAWLWISSAVDGLCEGISFELIRCAIFSAQIDLQGGANPVPQVTKGIGLDAVAKTTGPSFNRYGGMARLSRLQRHRLTQDQRLLRVSMLVG